MRRRTARNCYHGKVSSLFPAGLGQIVKGFGLERSVFSQEA